VSVVLAEDWLTDAESVEVVLDLTQAEYMALRRLVSTEAFRRLVQAESATLDAHLVLVASAVERD